MHGTLRLHWSSQPIEFQCPFRLITSPSSKRFVWQGTQSWMFSHNEFANSSLRVLGREVPSVISSSLLCDIYYLQLCNYFFDPLNVIHIWEVPLQQCCRDTCSIWACHFTGRHCFDNCKRWRKSTNEENILPTHHQRETWKCCSMGFGVISKPDPLKLRHIYVKECHRT